MRGEGRHTHPLPLALSPRAPAVVLLLLLQRASAGVHDHDLLCQPTEKVVDLGKPRQHLLRGHAVARLNLRQTLRTHLPHGDAHGVRARWGGHNRSRETHHRRLRRIDVIEELRVEHEVCEGLFEVFVEETRVARQPHHGRHREARRRRVPPPTGQVDQLRIRLASEILGHLWRVRGGGRGAGEGRCRGGRGRRGHTSLPS